MNEIALFWMTIHSVIFGLTLHVKCRLVNQLNIVTSMTKLQLHIIDNFLRIHSSVIEDGLRTLIVNWR